MASIPDFRGITSVLVIKPSSLGDIVHTLPAVHVLKQTFPQLRIDWLVNPEWAPLLDGNPDLHEVVLFPRREFGGWAGWSRFRAWLKDFSWRPPAEVALDFQGLLRSAFLARKSGAACIVGLSDSREGARFLHHVRVKVGDYDHAVDRYLKLAAACGAQGPLHFPLPAGSCPEAVHRAAVPRDFVVLHPFSRGTNKSITCEQVKRFCEAMAPIGVFIVGNATVPEQLLSLPPNAANILNETSLAELAWLLRRARFIVSVDSGPLHMAAAITDQLLGIYTWSDPRLVGPYPNTAWVWKGGYFLRRGEVTGAHATLNRPVEDEDIPKICDFVWQRLEESKAR